MRCKCGEENPKGAQYCQKCGNYLDNHKIAEFIGVITFIIGLIWFIFGIGGPDRIFFLFSLIFGAYLYLSEGEVPKKRGKSLMCASIVVWVIIILIKNKIITGL